MVAIFLLQSLYISSLYKKHLLIEQQNIEESIYEAIDLELHYRVVKNRTPEAEVEYKTGINDTRITLDQLPQELKDGMKKFLATVPKYNTEWADIQDLMDRKVIRSTGDIQNQIDQDWFRKKGTPINLHILDSLFQNRLSRNYASRLCLIDGDGQILCAEGDSTNYNYQTRMFPIGLEGEQSITASIDIKPSQFIKISILTLILSFIIVLLSLLSLAYLIAILRRKDEMLKQRETNINGIIHDLKSPLIGVSSMIDLYQMLEQDKDKKEILKCNKQSITLLCANVERLLMTTRDQITITKETLSVEQLLTRTETLVNGLKIKYSDKKTTIKISHHGFEKINIDTMCFDSVIVNLVENALKYSQTSVDVYIDITRRNKQLYISVSDNGIGISEQDSKRIFNHLYRGEHHNIQGYGIGLTYIRSLARAHGGDANLIISVIGVGSKFEVVINVE